MRPDARTQKNNIRGVLFLTAAAALTVTAFMLWGGSVKAIGALAALDLYFAAVFAFFVSESRRQRRLDPGSDDCIFCCGFSLFVLSILITLAVMTFRVIRFSKDYDGRQMLYQLAESAGDHMILSFPFIVFFSAVLFISGIGLMRNKGGRRDGARGMILSVLLIGAGLLLFRFDRLAAGSRSRVMLHDLIGNVFAATYLYLECMTIGAIVSIRASTNTKWFLLPQVSVRRAALLFKRQWVIQSLILCGLAVIAAVLTLLRYK